MIFYWHLSISNIIWLYKNTILSSWVLTGYTIYIFWIKWIKAFTTWIIFASFIKMVLILNWQSWFRTFIYFRLLQVLLTAKNVIHYVLTKMIRNSVGHLIWCYQKDWKCFTCWTKCIHAGGCDTKSWWDSPYRCFD